MSLKRDEDYELPRETKSAKIQGAKLDDLDPLAIDRVLSFLDVRSLFRLTFSSNGFRDICTREHVVRSALISGGHSKTTVSEVIDLALQKKTILMPSAPRLLRLANGKRCESKSCIGGTFPMEPYKGGIAKVNHCRPGYGLFFCWNCLTSKTVAIKIDDNMLANARVACSKYTSKAYVLRSPYTDSAGERAGPTVSRQESKRVGLVKSCLAVADQLCPPEERDSLLKCLAQAKADREKLEEEKKVKQASRKEGKKAKAIELVKKLKKALIADDDCEYIDTLCSYRDASAYHKQNEPSIIMKCDFVHTDMNAFIIAPSKGTKKKLVAVAENITATAKLLKSSGFLELSFLESDEAVDPWQSTLKSYLQNSQLGTGKKMLQRLTVAQVDRIREGRLFEAARRNNSWTNHIAKLIVSRYNSSIPDVFQEIHAFMVAQVLCLHFNNHDKADSAAAFTRNCTLAEEKFGVLVPIAGEFGTFLQKSLQKSTSDTQTILSNLFRSFGTLRLIERLENRRFVLLHKELNQYLR